MERNSPALIARTEGLSGEPLLTQWLAHLLRQPAYQGILIPFLAGEDIDHATLCDVTIRDEEGDSDGGGRPDIEIGCEAFALIVENKFDAGMTKNQPRGYLQVLKKRTAAKKVLAFLVPAWRKTELQKTLAPYTGKSTGIGIHVCTWEDLVELLTKSFAESELIHEFSGDIRKRCKLQSPLTLDELKIGSDILARWLNQRELLKAIRETLQAEPIFKDLTVALEAKPEWDEEHCYMGMTISASQWVFWIGFWNLLQSKDPNTTPLLGHVYESKDARKLFPKFWSSLKQLRAANIVAPLVPGHGWPIPVPIPIMQGKTVREQAENVVAYIVRVLGGDGTANGEKISNPW